MKTIAIVGANGQVGTEICLLLSQMNGVRVVPIVRTELGAVLLARCGLDCRIGNPADPDAARALYAGCDLVADFSLPRGIREDARRFTRRILDNIATHAPTGVPLVYMSTTMAFGMQADASAYRRMLWARSSYAVDKRRAERLARLFGFAQRRPVYVLRLGQVHGELQRVSRSMLAALASGAPIALRDGGKVPSDAVFCSTIAVALARIARGQASPGTYTLLEAPDLSWGQLYAFFAQQAGVALDIVAAGPSAAEVGRASLRRALGAVKRLGFSLLRENKELLTAHGLGFRRELELLAKTAWHAQRARAEIAEGRAPHLMRPSHYDGPVPGKRLPGLRAPEAARERDAAARALRALLEEKLGPEGHNFPSQPPSARSA